MASGGGAHRLNRFGATQSCVYYSRPCHKQKRSVGGYSGEGPPDPISNSEVKLSSADGTTTETSWESRSLPTYFFAPVLPGFGEGGLFYFLASAAGFGSGCGHGSGFVPRCRTVTNRSRTAARSSRVFGWAMRVSWQKSGTPQSLRAKKLASCPRCRASPHISVCHDERSMT